MAFLSRIRSIQRGTLTIADVSTSGTATLGTTLTDLTKSELRYLGNDSASTSTDPKSDACRITLTNTTTVTGTRTGNNGAAIISYEVTEWY